MAKSYRRGGKGSYGRGSNRTAGRVRSKGTGRGSYSRGNTSSRRGSQQTVRVVLETVAVPAHPQGPFVASAEPQARKLAKF